MSKAIALVTGVTRETGLGLGLVKGLVSPDRIVYATGRKLEDVAALVDGLPGVHALALDITDSESIAAALGTIQEAHGYLDVLINNAAAFFDAGNTVVDSDMEMVRNAFETNTLGAWRLTVAALPLLRKSAEGATVTNVTSGAGSFHDPMFGMSSHPQHVPVYAVTKAAANAMTVKLAKELESAGIHVNAVCPGWVATYPGTLEMGATPVEEAVPDVLWVADYASNPTTGGFFRNRKPLDW